MLERPGCAAEPHTSQMSVARSKWYPLKGGRPVALFGSSKKNSGGGAAASSAAATDARDPRKARRFFDHAEAVAATRNYDYAIECYINGLRHDPEALDRHEALRDVALRRKVNGGKGPGFQDKFKHGGGKGAVEKMLNAEFLWSKDPFNPQLALQVFENAVEAELEEVAYWVGTLVLEANRAAKKPSKDIFVKAKDRFSQIGAYDKAVEAARQIAAIEPGNMQLLHELKNLEAEMTLMTGGYDDENASFRTGVKDAEKQRALEQEDAIAQTESAIDETIKRLRQDYEQDPEDQDKLQKLVRTLQEKEDSEAEDEAIQLLSDAYERTGQYRLKMQMGDIRMKQYNRRTRLLRQQMGATDDEAERKQLEQQLKELANEQVGFELEEYSERVKNYPTDMGLRYQLGRRQFVLGDYDAAIGSFQEAQSDPKYRAQALRYLGDSFSRKEWLDEAIDTFHRAIEIHPYSDDRLAMELRYELMRTLGAKARRDSDLQTAQEASKLASQIAQTNINYRDIRNHLETLRKLVTDLKSGGSGGSDSKEAASV